VSVERTAGGRWRVRWREAGRERSKTVDRKREAAHLDAEIKRLQRLGVLRTLEIGIIPLRDFAHAWWDAHASHLAPMTQRQYAEVLDLHVIRRLGGYQLRSLSPAVVDDFRVALERDHVGAPTVLKALTVLSSICRHAVVRGELVTNPVREVPKPRQRRSGRQVRPLTPAMIERLRSRLPRRDATLVSLIGYAGLRPSEAFGLRWLNVRDRTLLIEGGVVLGEERDETKTDRARTVRLLDPLARDLAEWRLASGRPGERTLLFSRSDGVPWRDHDYRNWRKRVFRPAALAAGVERPRPYDLRHSFVSLLIHEGVSIVEVARQAGHSPAICLRTYAHVIEEFDPADRRSAEEEIRRARGELVSPMCHEAGSDGS
jgi:integrase